MHRAVRMSLGVTVILLSACAALVGGGSNQGVSVN